MRFSIESALPGIVQLLPLTLSSDERWVNSGQRLLDDGLDGRRREEHELLVGLTGRRTRVDAHFALQDGDTGVVDVQRAGTIVVEREQAHQAAIELFGEGIEREQALSGADGSDGVALHLKEAQQVFECLLVALAEPLPL